MTAWRSACRLTWMWASPILLLSIPVEIFASGRKGLWLALLVFIAPLLGLLLVPTSSPERERGGGSLYVFVTALMVGGLLWANLTLAADVAAWMGGPRWSGVLVGSAAAFALAAWRGGDRVRPLFIAAALVGTFGPLGMVLSATDPLPHRVWAGVASAPMFTFPPSSRWVTEGREVGNYLRDGLLFLEEHRLVALTAGPLRVAINDGGRAREEEWRVKPGQPFTLRPGDRLIVQSSARLRFEEGKRVPGAPLSGIDWADGPIRSRKATLAGFLGLGATLAGGAVALVTLAGGLGARSRSGVGLAGLLLLAVVLWGEIWAIYAAAFTPELFLGGVSAPALLEFPTLVFSGSRWGRWVSWVVVAGLLSWFLASASALRDALASDGGQPGEDRGALWLWAGLVATAGLLSLWPLSPWRLALVALGLGASTLAPVILLGTPAGRPRVATWAVGVGLVLFVGLTAVGRLAVPASAVAQMVVAYPALVAAPVAAGVLWVAGRPAGPSPGVKPARRGRGGRAASMT